MWLLGVAVRRRRRRWLLGFGGQRVGRRLQVAQEGRKPVVALGRCGLKLDCFGSAADVCLVFVLGLHWAILNLGDVEVAVRGCG